MVDCSYDWNNLLVYLQSLVYININTCRFESVDQLSLSWDNPRI